MKKFNLIILAAIFLLEVSAAYAEEKNVFDFPVNHNNSSLRKALAEFSQYDISRGSFTQVKTISRISKTFESSGIFVFSSLNGIIWKVLHPIPSTLVLTEKRIIQIASDGTLNRTDVSEDRTFRNFSSAILSVFSGRIESLNSHFNIYFLPGNKITIGLIPKDPIVKDIIKSLVLRGSSHLESLTLQESTGDSISYNFTMETQGGELENEEISLFKF